ncbi:MAG TPA: hypothetical protein VIH99_06765 [Bdellovibrionota bacterium]|jgi:hypothetical protein
MKSFFSLMAILFLVLSLPAHADEAADAEQEQKEKEKGYQLLCVPGTSEEQNLSPDDRADLPKQRARFHSLLSDPDSILGPLEMDIFSGKNVMGAVMEYAFTCAIVDTLKDEIEKRGCADEAGKNFTAAKALESCTLYGKRIQRLVGSKDE